MTDHPRLRVLDLTDDLALQAARLFVGAGADVIRVVTADAAQTSLADELHWHAGKRVVHEEPDRLDALVSRLLPGADVVLESGPVDRLRTLELREADPEAWQHVAHVVVTPFGLTGPRSGWLADDTVGSAAGGMAWLGGDPGEAPVPTPRQQSTQLAGTHAAIAALLALVARGRTGKGQFAEVSMQEAVAASLETGAISWIHAGTVPGRTSGVYGHVAHRVFESLDGHVAGGYSGPNRMWTDLLAWMDEAGEAQDLTDEVWQDPVHRWRHREHVDCVVADFARRRTTEDLARGGRERALPWAAVATPADLLDNPQLVHRGFIVDVKTPRGVVRDAGFPYRSPGQPAQLAAPERATRDVVWNDEGGHARATAGESAPAPRQAQPPGHPAQGALAGLKVLDLTWVLAGPYVTKTLAEHGAEIIKVESRHRQDPTRFSPSMRLRPGAGPDESGYFLNFNRNKRSLALNLRTEAGVDLLRRLAREADVIVENFSPGVLAKWGLDWERLRGLNPGAILISMAGVGATGPWSRAVTFADTLAAMAGLTHETGVGGRPPQGLTFGLGDIVAANAATVATLDLLLAGRGGHVDLSQLEAMAAHLGTAALDHQVPPEPSEWPGPFVLRAAGEDRWLAVGTTPTDALREAVTAAQLFENDAPTSVSDPVTALAELSAQRDPDELAALLQAHGVAAYPVRDGRDLVETDPQLAARGFHPEQAHPIVGTVKVEGIVSHLAETPGALRSPAPTLGQHTAEILAEYLGVGADEIDDLHRQGVLE